MPLDAAVYPGPLVAGPSLPCGWRRGGAVGDVDWRGVLDWSMLDLNKAGRTARARERLEACLLSS